MSQENVETAHRCFDAFSSRDPEAFLGLVHPDVEWRPSLTIMPQDGDAVFGTYHGHDGIRQWFADASQIEEYRVDPTEFRDVDNHVLITAKLSLMVGSHIYLSDIFIVLTFRDAKVVSGITYTDKAGALEAAGVSE